MALAYEKDIYLFHQGTNYESYRLLGAHRAVKGKVPGTVFRTWAPNAKAVFVTGDFNNWDESLPMKKITREGLWEAFLPGEVDNSKRLKYKYMIVSEGRICFKADPYARFAGTMEETASYLYIPEEYQWSDGGYMAQRRQNMTPKADTPAYSLPMNIYEVHLGSFRRRGDGSFMNYRELADCMAPYVKKMGYTHVELMPVMEHPLDGSWGYQVCGFYAPTSRFGAPEDFKYFINTMHRYGIGVILDWVPAHFPRDAHGLFEFDGGPLYEYQGKDRMDHKVWGTRFFDVGRPEVQSFLVSNAVYWLEEFHADGLRVDAVASMLYLDYDRAPGEWTPAQDGSNKNYEAIAFFRKLNTEVFRRMPDVLMVAEESTAWPMITKPVYMGGLGFNFKWNMGWQNDMAEYIGKDPVYRRGCHNALTFSMMYSFSENFILPVSHDEVVHGKKSLIDKMWGGYEEKFAGARLFFAYMMCHPGKKLTFMGCEYGQFREWDFNSSLEWFMTGYDMHAKLLKFNAVLNHLYLETPSLWERDLSWDGFAWVKSEDRDANVSAFLRKDAKGEYTLCVFNFSNSTHTGYRLGVPKPGLYREELNTDDERFGGKGRHNLPVRAKEIKEDGFAYSLSLDIPPLSAIIVKREIYRPE